MYMRWCLLSRLTPRKMTTPFFSLRVQQAGLFELSGYDDNERSAITGSYCPSILFPYAREAIASVMQKGGFPEFVLQPINFDALYMQSQQQAAESAADGGEALIDSPRLQAVIGAGSWGTALALQFARSGSEVRLWGRDSEQTCADGCAIAVTPAICPGVVSRQLACGDSI